MSQIEAAIDYDVVYQFAEKRGLNYNELSAMVRAALSQQSPASSPDPLREALIFIADMPHGFSHEKAREIARAALASPAPSVEPAGWRLVPIEPTFDMLFEGAYEGLLAGITTPLPMAKIWVAMLGQVAAPTAAVHEPEARDQGHPAQSIGGGKESGAMIVVCSCSSPDCVVNGCAAVRRLQPRQPTPKPLSTTKEKA